MPCNVCSLDGVVIKCTTDARCPGALFCTITNTNTDHAVNATVRLSFSTGAPSVTETILLPAGGSQPLGCDSANLGQTTTFDITGVQVIRS